MTMEDHCRGDDTQGADSRSLDDDPRLADLVFHYIEKLNAGEAIDEQQVVRDQPDIGPAILTELHTYLRFDSMRAVADNQPLGTLGDYTLRRQIGRGGMGVVYEAWENSMDRAVALKVLPAGFAADDRAFQRFLQEAKAAGKLSHPNVVPVYFTGVRGHTPFYAMELVEGETLAQVLAKVKDAEPETETPFGPKGQVDYFLKLAHAFADVADGLQHAHSRGVTHRDIKPSNLILDRNGHLRILDFGLAHLEGHESLTLSRDVVGTPLYMSPEQAQRKNVPVDNRTDVYSLGATMYEASCGRPPFRGKDHADTLSQIIEREPVEPREGIRRGWRANALRQSHERHRGSQHRGERVESMALARWRLLVLHARPGEEQQAPRCRSRRAGADLRSSCGYRRGARCADLSRVLRLV